MEVKINREIRKYTESIFFGLSLRQFICSIGACIGAVLVYLLFNGKVHTELVSWGCVMVAAPFAALGFVTYNGMTAEQFCYSFIKSEILTPKKLICKPQNFYYELLKDKIDKEEN